MVDTKLQLPSGSLTAYVAEPSVPPRHAGVVVVHEAFGLNDDIRSICDRVAGLGYVAVAPDLVDGGRPTCIARAFYELQRGRGRAPRALEECADWLAAREDVEASRIAAIGFCMGGGYAFLLGLSGKVAAAAPNYGQPPSDGELAASCPVVASYGGRDLMFRRFGPRVERALQAAGIPHDVEVYPDSGHSFMNRSAGHRVMKAFSRPLVRLGYSPEDAEHAWDRIERFFDLHLGS